MVQDLGNKFTPESKGFGIRMADGSVTWFYNSNPRCVKV